MSRKKMKKKKTQEKDNNINVRKVSNFNKQAFESGVTLYLYGAGY